MTHVLVVVALGAAIGLLSGLFGVGGSSVSTPLLRVVLNTPRLLALATPLPVAIPIAITGGLVYRRQGFINGSTVTWTIIGGVPGVVLGALLTKWISAHWLMFFTAAVVFAVGLQLMRSRPAASTGQEVARIHQWQAQRPAKIIAVAIPVGLLSGLLANGGGFLLVPAFVLMFGATVRQAAATSLPCVAALAIPATITHALLGHVDGWLSLELSLGAVPATFLGAELSLWFRRIHLRRPFGGFLSAFGVYFFVRELLQAI